MSALSTIPASIEFGGQEIRTIAVDLTDALSEYPLGTVPTAPEVSLVDMSSGASIGLPGPVIVGMQIHQLITGPNTLTPGHQYSLQVVVTPSGVFEERVEIVTTINVPLGT